jgi:hypothetical protein
MKKTFIALSLFILGMTALNSNSFSQKMTVCDLKSDMRKLWEDHVTWTRNVIINIIDNAPGLTEDIGRLLQNQVDIGNAIKPFYGEAAGTSLTNYLHNHITIAGEILVALKTGDNAALTDANSRWLLNADSISTFLASANPCWKLQELKDMMHNHLNLTTAEAVARFSGNYKGDVIAYDNVHNEILMMSDMLTDGIVCQFPGKFRGPKDDVATQDVRLTQKALLFQNSPNPFTDKTTITYYVPENAKYATIVVSDHMGTEFKTIILTQRGKGSLTINASEVGRGVYTSTLIIDGQVIDSRKMVHEY